MISFAKQTARKLKCTDLSYDAISSFIRYERYGFLSKTCRDMRNTFTEWKTRI